jgi:hypothetical protein
MYRTVYLNFLTRIERPLLEKLASELVANNSVSLVSKIYDQYLDLIALEPTMFTLNIKNSFSSYNETSLTESEIRWQKYFPFLDFESSLIMFCDYWDVKELHGSNSYGLVKFGQGSGVYSSHQVT